jgi:hypothetical protein
MGSCKERVNDNLRSLFFSTKHGHDDGWEWIVNCKNSAIMDLFLSLQMKTMMRKRKGEGEEEYLLQQPVSSGSGPIHCTPGGYNKTQSTYVCRVQSSVWRLPKYWSPTPFPVPPPAPKAGGGGTHSPGGEGSLFWKTPDIGLASYSIISLRNKMSSIFADR